jgi:serine/threonine protein kinase
MSPEQCRGSDPIDEKTDVYSLGVIFYKLLYSQPPFISNSSSELFAMHLFAPPPELKTRLPEVEPKLLELCHRLLAKKPAERPSMAELLNELQALPTNALQDGPIEARPSRKYTRDEAPSFPSGILGKQLSDNATSNIGRGEKVAPKVGSQRKIATVLSAAGLLALAVSLPLYSGRRRSPEHEKAPAVTAPADLGVKTSDGNAAQSPGGVPVIANKPESAAPPAQPIGKKLRKSRSDRKGAQGPKNGKVDLELWN